MLSAKLSAFLNISACKFMRGDTVNQKIYKRKYSQALNCDGYYTLNGSTYLHGELAVATTCLNMFTWQYIIVTYALYLAVDEWILYSFYPKKSTFFNMAVTESDVDPKVRKMFIIFY